MPPRPNRYVDDEHDEEMPEQDMIYEPGFSDADATEPGFEDSNEGEYDMNDENERRLRNRFRRELAGDSNRIRPDPAIIAAQREALRAQQLPRAARAQLRQRAAEMPPRPVARSEEANNAPEAEEDRNGPPADNQPLQQQPVNVPPRRRPGRPARQGGAALPRDTAWVITAHGQVDLWRSLTDGVNVILPDGVQFLSFQREVGENGDPNFHGGRHWQMYAVFDREVDQNEVMRILGLDPAHTWVQIRYGPHERAFAYTQDTNKPGSRTLRWYEEPSAFDDPEAMQQPGNMNDYMQFHGERPGWNRNAARLNAVEGYQAAAKMAQQGASMREIAQAFPGIAVRYFSGLQKISMMNQKSPKYRQITVKVFWGDTRTGKSRTAWQEAEALGIDLYKKIKGSDNVNGTIFWELYEDQKGILLEEFEGHKTFPLSYFLDLLDGNPMPLNVKGSSRHAMFTHVWICTNVHPDLWYPNANPKQLAALRKRIPDSNIFHFAAQEEQTQQENQEEEEAV